MKLCSVRILTPFLALSFFAMTVPTATAVKNWSPAPPAAVTPPSITVGSVVGGPSGPVSDGGSVTIQKGETVMLAAKSNDEDSYTENAYNGYAPDEGYINWSTTGGTLSATRTKNGATVNFSSAATGAFKVTAQATDQWTGTETGVTPPDTGKRNDLATGTTVTITINVVEACPTNIAISSTCAVTDYAKYFWANSMGMGGATFAKMEVSGGTPPGGAKNWNGLFVRQVVAADAQKGDVTAADFVTGFPFGDLCHATVQGFIVGLGQSGAFNCTFPQANNCFYDPHFGPTYPLPDRYTKKGDGTFHCNQYYQCGTTRLKTGGATDSFTITRTFHNATYQSVRRTQVQIAKNAS